MDPRFLRLGPFKDRATIRVAVMDADEPPRFSRSRYLMDVSENCPPACTVGRVSAIDPDTGLTNNIRYSLKKKKKKLFKFVLRDRCYTFCLQSYILEDAIYFGAVFCSLNQINWLHSYLSFKIAA